MEKLQVVEDLREMEFAAKGAALPKRITKKTQSPEWMLRGKVAGICISVPEQAADAESAPTTDVEAEASRGTKEACRL